MEEKQAFTLLEVLAAISITVVTAFLGIFGFFFYRNTVELDNSTRDLLSYITTLKNDARNSVLVENIDFNNTDRATDKLPDYYLFVLGRREYRTIYCKEVASRLECTNTDPQELNHRFGNVTFDHDCSFGESDTLVYGFTRREAKLVAVDIIGGMIESRGICPITLSHSAYSGETEIILDLDTNEVTTERI